MLNADRLACERGGRCLFRDLAFSLRAGELLTVQGSNGSGKTSLLRMLCGFSSPAAGEIRWQGTPVMRLGGDYRREICYLGHLNALKDDLTPLENLQTAAALSADALAAGAANAALAALGLTGCEDLPCRHLSQGQRRRVVLSRLIHERRPLWVLDEPFVALDAAAVEQVAGLIADHLQRGGLAVLTTHQPVNVRTRAHRNILLG